MESHVCTSEEVKENYIEVNNTASNDTPTPSRFMQLCETVGLFQDLSKNPFDTMFDSALDDNYEKKEKSDDSLNTPTLIINDEDCIITEVSPIKRKTFDDDDKEDNSKRNKLDKWERIRKLQMNIRNVYGRSTRNEDNNIISNDKTISPKVIKNKVKNIENRRGLNREAQSRIRYRIKKENEENIKEMANLKKENGELQLKDEQLNCVYRRVNSLVKKIPACDSTNLQLVNASTENVINQNLDVKENTNVDTPTRLIEDCERVGLFNDINPFEETFINAMENRDKPCTLVPTSEDSLNTPVILLEETNCDKNINAADNNNVSKIDKWERIEKLHKNISNVYGKTYNSKKNDENVNNLAIEITREEHKRALNRLAKARSRERKKQEDLEYEEEMKKLKEKNEQLHIKNGRLHSEVQMILSGIKNIAEAHQKCDKCNKVLLNNIFLELCRIDQTLLMINSRNSINNKTNGIVQIFIPANEEEVHDIIEHNNIERESVNNLPITGILKKHCSPESTKKDEFPRKGIIFNEQVVVIVFPMVTEEEQNDENFVLDFSQVIRCTENIKSN